MKKNRARKTKSTIAKKICESSLIDKIKVPASLLFIFALLFLCIQIAFADFREGVGYFPSTVGSSRSYPVFGVLGQTLSVLNMSVFGLLGLLFVVSIFWHLAGKGPLPLILNHKKILLLILASYIVIFILDSPFVIPLVAFVSALLFIKDYLVTKKKKYLANMVKAVLVGIVSIFLILGLRFSFEHLQKNLFCVEKFHFDALHYSIQDDEETLRLLKNITWDKSTGLGKVQNYNETVRDTFSNRVFMPLLKSMQIRDIHISADVCTKEKRISHSDLSAEYIYDIKHEYCTNQCLTEDFTVKMHVDEEGNIAATTIIPSGNENVFEGDGYKLSYSSDYSLINQNEFRLAENYNYEDVIFMKTQKVGGVVEIRLREYPKANMLTSLDATMLTSIPQSEYINSSEEVLINDNNFISMSLARYDQFGKRTGEVNAYMYGIELKDKILTFYVSNRGIEELEKILLSFDAR